MIPEVIHPYSRRKFLATSVSALGLVPMAYLRGQQGSPNDEIAMGVVGCGGQGLSDMINFLSIAGVRVVAICDVDAGHIQHVKGVVNDHYKNQDCKSYVHYADLLQHPGLDAVLIATPDHCHAQVGIAAAKAGKDIYGEKPFTWGLGEGRLLVNALTQNKRVWQTGCWQRSSGEFRRFKALIERGTIGKVTRMECGTPGGIQVQQHAPPEKWAEMIGKAPGSLDWAAYCGPVKGFPYHPMIHPWNWRWHHTFGGGNLMDWVGHHVDIALWSVGLDGTGPVRVEGSGKISDHGFFNSYTDYSYKGTFADGRVLEVRSEHFGVKFTGEKGWIHVNRGQLEASDRELLRNVPADFDTKPPSHYQNFIDCVRSRKLTVAHAEAGHRAASFGQLGIVAMDSKQPVKWDPKSEKVIGNADQAKHPRLGARVTA
jgi:predicted dehydrogenase